MNPQQIEIEFTPGLTQQFPELIDLLATVVRGCPGGINSVALDLDISPGNLGRMLNRDAADNRHFPANWIAAVVESTGDKRPVYWLIEKFLEDSEVKRKRALDELPALMARINEVLEAAK